MAPLGFSARWNALWREYRYILWHDGLDLELMRSAADMLKGEHDFQNFSTCKEDTVRNIHKLDISEEDGLGLVTFDVRANGFLWNMVRKIVRVLEMLGSGEKDLDWIEDLLNTELNRGAPSAPAEGLILMDVGYDCLEWQVDEYSRERAAKALAATVQRRMSSAHVARILQRAMER
jgi:tRNA pseudouridine38-40 synthase